MVETFRVKPYESDFSLCFLSEAINLATQMNSTNVE